MSDEQIERIAQRVAELVRAPNSSGPLTSWKAVAEAVGVSEDTLRRRRAERPDLDLERPYFESATEARRWWAALLAPAPLRRARRGQTGRPQ